MSERTTTRQLARTGLVALICIAIELTVAWFGEMLITVSSVMLGIVVGLVVWFLSDLQTGFLWGFLAWILGWFFFFVMRILLDVAVDFIFHTTTKHRPDDDIPVGDVLDLGCDADGGDLD